MIHHDHSPQTQTQVHMIIKAGAERRSQIFVQGRLGEHTDPEQNDRGWDPKLEAGQRNGIGLVIQSWPDAVDGVPQHGGEHINIVPTYGSSAQNLKKRCYDIRHEAKTV